MIILCHVTTEIVLLILPKVLKICVRYQQLRITTGDFYYCIRENVLLYYSIIIVIIIELLLL